MKNNESTCRDCQYFIQHYGKDELRGYHSIHCGHCKKTKRQKLKPDSEICVKFLPINKAEENKRKQKAIAEVYVSINDKLSKLLEYIED